MHMMLASVALPVPTTTARRPARPRLLALRPAPRAGLPVVQRDLDGNDPSGQAPGSDEVGPLGPS